MLTALGVCVAPADHARRKNCANNPNCLFGLGERGDCAGIWAKEPAFLLAAGPDLALQSRDWRALPCGLINLGSTCYVNVLLQCLYWNPRFRHALFTWKPQIDTDDAGAVQQDAAVSALQRIFGVMQYGARTFATIAEFVDALQLPRSVQQDAEEFHKMLLGLLGERLKASPVAAVQDVIPRTFAGLLQYETTCARCPAHVHRTQREEFYEIVRVHALCGAAARRCAQVHLCALGVLFALLLRCAVPALRAAPEPKGRWRKRG